MITIVTVAAIMVAMLAFGAGNASAFRSPNSLPQSQGPAKSEDGNGYSGKKQVAEGRCNSIPINNTLNAKCDH
jgi:hypothetical protein